MAIGHFSDLILTEVFFLRTQKFELFDQLRSIFIIIIYIHISQISFAFNNDGIFCKKMERFDSLLNWEVTDKHVYWTYLYF